MRISDGRPPAADPPCRSTTKDTDAMTGHTGPAAPAVAKEDE